MENVSWRHFAMLIDRVNDLEKQFRYMNEPDYTSARIEELEAEKTQILHDSSTLRKIERNLIKSLKEEKEELKLELVRWQDEAAEWEKEAEALKAENEDLKTRNSNQLETIANQDFTMAELARENDELKEKLQKSRQQRTYTFETMNRYGLALRDIGHELDKADTEIDRGSYRKLIGFVEKALEL